MGTDLPYHYHLPQVFCWTKMGTEAGETLDAILERKEAERSRNGGLFLWGIGNSVGPGLRALLREDPTPEAIFTPMLTKPKSDDVAPARTVRWNRGIGIDGAPWPLPAGSLVTSRSDAGGLPKRHHYALVCWSDAPLTLCDLGTLDSRYLRNFATGSEVGSSQVTSVVRTVEAACTHGRCYSVALRCRLAFPFFVELSEPVGSGSNLPADRSQAVLFE